MKLRIAALVGLAVIALLAVLLNYRSQSRRAFKLGEQTVQMAPSYTANSPYYLSLLSASHEAAMKDSASPPSTTRSQMRAGSFSETGYQESLIRQMIARAAGDGRKDIEQELLDLYQTKFGRAPDG